jgi:tetratricopeptide (TPR) repeat protein
MVSNGQPQRPQASGADASAQSLDQAEQWLMRGHRALAVTLAQEVITQAESVIASPELYAQLLARASEVLSNAGEDAAAFQASQHALRVKPGHAFATYVAARALKHLEQFTDAEALLDTGLVHHPDDLGLLRLKADLLTTHGAFAEAATFLRVLVQQAPRDEVAWYNLSNALLNLRQYSEALAAAERAIALAPPPQVADAWVNKGRALAGMGKDQSAVTSFQEALRINRLQLHAHHGLALLYWKQGQRLSAWKEHLYERLLSMLYRARYYTKWQLQREQLRSLSMADDIAGSAPASEPH